MGYKLQKLSDRSIYRLPQASAIFMLSPLLAVAPLGWGWAIQLNSGNRVKAIQGMSSGTKTQQVETLSSRCGDRYDRPS